MKYDFTSSIDRQGTNSIAVDGVGCMPGFAPEAPEEGFDIIPMWIADMNFPTAPSVIEALKERLTHPIFGYFFESEEYYQSIIRWQKNRNHVDSLSKEHIGYQNGVLGGVITALNALASPGDYVLIHSPAYVGFIWSVEKAGYRIVYSPLKQDENGIWRMDYEDMDKKMKEYKIHVAIFCNPHNPTGRVWKDEEIKEAMKVYQANNCVVIADEIWSDIVLNHHKHTPTQSVNDDAKNRTIALYSLNKTFNLAGCIGAYHIIYNDYLRDLIVSQSEKTHYNEMNLFFMHALIGAYKEENEEWVDELKEVLSENVNYACNFIERHFPGVSFSKPQGTYMLYLDCEQWCKNSGKDFEDVLKAGRRVGVTWMDGRAFHGNYTLRMNLALPTSRVKEAFERLKNYVFV